MQKIWYSYSDIHRVIKNLADNIQSSSFKPEVMVSIGAGGFIPARILRTYLKIPIYTVTVAYYDEYGQVTDKPKIIQWLDRAEHLLKGKQVLLVDEVDDSRVTLEFCLKELHQSGIHDVAIAVLHEKIKEKKGQFPDDLPAYFSGITLDDKWICYPWDALDIDDQEKKSSIMPIKYRNV